MTLAISVLNNTISCILNCYSIISSTPLYYTKYHTVKNIQFMKLHVGTMGLILDPHKLSWVNIKS